MSLALKIRLGYQASQSMVAPAGIFHMSRISERLISISKFTRSKPESVSLSVKEDLAAFPSKKRKSIANRFKM